MEEQDERLRTELMESMMEYLEGNRTLRAVLAIGITAYNRDMPKMPALAATVVQLNIMGNQVSEGKNYSREYIKETFTTLLEKLAQ